jgi:hypothetical protein
MWHSSQLNLESFENQAEAGNLQIQDGPLGNVLVQVVTFRGCHTVMICSATTSTQQLMLWDPGGDPYFSLDMDPYWLPTQGWLFGCLQKQSHQLIWILALVLKKGYVLQFILMSSSCRSFQ